MKISATTTSATIALTAPGIDRRRDGGAGGAGFFPASGVGSATFLVPTSASGFAVSGAAFVESVAGSSALIGRFGLTARKLLGIAGWLVR
jgi:hypothetical protein